LHELSNTIKNLLWIYKPTSLQAYKPTSLQALIYGLILSTIGCLQPEQEPAAYSSGPTCLNFDEFEKSEQFIYEFFKHGLMNQVYEENIPHAIREDFLEVFGEKLGEVENMTYSQAVAHFYGENEIGVEMRTELLGLYSFLDAAINSSSPKFQDLQSGLDDLITSAKESESFNCQEKNFLVLTYFSLKGVFQYFEEIYHIPNSLGAEAIDLRQDCGFWNTVWCFTGPLLSSTLTGGLSGGGAGYIREGTAGIGSGLEGGLIGGAIRGVIAGISALIDGCCPIDCHAITGVSVRFTGCDPEAVYTAFGFGEDAVTLFWENDNGTPETALTSVAIPRLTITQTNTSEDVRTLVTTNCNDQTSRVISERIEMNLYNDARKATGASLWGPVSVAPGFTYTYGLYGSFLNPNVTITQWYVTNGTIVNDNGTSVEVQWDGGLTSGMIQAEVTNTCPNGQIVWLTVNVTGDGPIP
jgi:hypothetical protein